MLNIAIIVGIAVTLVVIGLLAVRAELLSLQTDTSFATEYLQTFRRYMESRGKSGEAYGWLTMNAVRMQQDLGQLGVMNMYRPAGATFSYNHYPIVINMLPALHQDLTGQFADIMTEPLRYMAQTINDAIIRYFGVLERREHYLRKKSKNPVVLLREGFQQILILPFMILGWFGLYAEGNLTRLRRSRLVQAISGVVTLLGVLAAIVSLVVGWPAFKGIVRGWISQ